MNYAKRRILSVFLAVIMIFSSFAVTNVFAENEIEVGSWYESVFAQWDTSAGSEPYSVYYKKSSDSEYTQADSELIRTIEAEQTEQTEETEETSVTKVRVDIPGLAKDTSYDLKITSSEGTIYEGSLTTKAYDRSGYAHFGYSSGVGAYNNDGTPKDNAKIIYLTEENKNTVTIDGYESQVGIGNILNCCSETNAQKFLTGLTITDNHPLIIRVIGKVTLPDYLSEYDSSAYGGTVGDDGCMATIKGARNITVEGIGEDAVIEGWGMSFYHSNSIEATTPDAGESFEVRNITFQQYPEDALGFQGEMNSAKTSITAPIQRCWVHNNTFNSGYCANPTESDKADGDGSCDFKRGYYLTVAYNHFADCHKTNLIGAGEDNLQYHITFHHNYWEDCGARMPMTRNANIHSYNNYFKGSTSTTIDVRANAYLFSEANYFDSCKNPYSTDKEGGGFIKSYNDIVYNTVEQKNGTSGLTVASSRAQQVETTNEYPNFDTDSSVFYYENGVSNVAHLTDAVTAKAECIAYSGVMNAEAEVVESTLVTADTTPNSAVTIPASIDFTNSGLTIAANEVAEYQSMMIYAAKKYSGSGGITVKANGVTFKLDDYAVVTIADGGEKYQAVIVDELGNVKAAPDAGESVSVVLEPGIYIVQSVYTEKEAKLNSISIEEYTGETSTTTESSTAAATESQTESSTAATTESQTESSTAATTESQTESSTAATTESQTETTTAQLTGNLIAQDAQQELVRDDSGSGNPYYVVTDKNGNIITDTAASNYVTLNEDGTVSVIDTEKTYTTRYIIPFEPQTEGKLLITTSITPSVASTSWTLMQIHGTDGEVLGIRTDSDKVYGLRVNAGSDYISTSTASAAGETLDVEFLIDIDAKTARLTIGGSDAVETDFECDDISSVQFVTATNARNITVSGTQVIVLSDDTTDTAYKKGDVDGDGYINASDALICLQYVLNSDIAIESKQIEAMRVKDGDITATNAILIIQKSLNDDFQFPIS